MWIFTEWLLHDHLGSVRASTNATGDVKKRINYDPYGNRLEDEESIDLIPGYTGLFWDGVAETQLTMVRVLNPPIGIFQQPDPKKRIPSERIEDNSLYSYCGGDPVNYTDKNGLQALPTNFTAYDWFSYRKMIMNSQLQTNGRDALSGGKRLKQTALGPHIELGGSSRQSCRFSCPLETSGIPDHGVREG